MAKIKGWTVKVQFAWAAAYYVGLKIPSIIEGFYTPTELANNYRRIVFAGFCSDESANQAAETITAELRRLIFNSEAFVVSVFEVA